MKPRFQNGKIIAQCSSKHCEGSITTYERTLDNKPLGDIVVDGTHHYKGYNYNREIWSLLRCASCGSGGLVKIHCDNDPNKGTLESFYPTSIEIKKLPQNVPEDIKSEFREAEKCFSFDANRASSGLIRSTLEKILKAHNYKTGSLEKKIDDAVIDGVLTASKAKRAHENIRILGNNVLHDEWREIDSTEVEESLHYAHRIIEEFYDDPTSVKAILIEKGRIV